MTSLPTLILAILAAIPQTELSCTIDYDCAEYATVLADAVEDAARVHKIRPTLLLAVAWTESRMNPDAINPRAGDWGVWQLHPGTPWSGYARGMCQSAIGMCILAQAHAAGALLAANKRRCRNWRGALASYHYGGCKRRRSAYVERVLRREGTIQGIEKRLRRDR